MKDRPTETELLNALLQGGAAREKAIKKFFFDDPAPMKWVKNFVLKNNGSPEDVEEVFDDAVVFFDANVKREQFKEKSKVMTYFFEIAKKQWYSRYNKKQKDLQQFAQNIENEPKSNVTDEPDWTDEHLEMLDYGMGQLDERQREILLAKYNDNMSMKEIAAAFDLSSDQLAKKYVHRSRGYLLEHIKRHPLYTQIAKKRP